MLRYISIFVLIGLNNLFISASVLRAQGAPKPKPVLVQPKDTLTDPELLDGVTVIGLMSVVRTRQSAQPITLVSKTDLNRQSAANVIDALTRLVPGLTALTTGPAISKPVIRGLGYNRILTLHDGVRQEGQQWGDEHGIEVDEASVQKAEVMKGPASLLYGSDGMGGVIHLLSTVPFAKGTRQALVQSGFQSNNGLWSVHANLGAHQKNGFNWRVYVSGKSAGDYRNASDGKVLNSRFSEFN
jgi:iron complex outermembrane receptor protein